MGRTFDNLSSTYLATSEFLRTNNPNVIGSRQDLALLQNLHDAARFTLRYDYSRGIDGTYVCGINAQLTRTAAIQPGFLRNAPNIHVHTTHGDYMPGIPDRHQLKDVLREANRSMGSLRDACILFARLAKMQPFGDGNKRTALLAANGLLMMRDTGNALIVPTSDPDRKTFNDLLASWYLEGNKDVMAWLARFNAMFNALDDDGHPISVAEE